MRTVSWRGKGVKWSEADEQLIRRLLREGKKWHQAMYLFPTRTRDAVRNKFKWEKNGGGPYPIDRVSTFKIPVPIHLIEDRDLRANEPRTLTAILCGDPPFSQSALAQK